MNTFNILKGLLFIAFTTKFVCSDNEVDSSLSASQTASSTDVSSVHISAHPQTWYDDDDTKSETASISTPIQSSVDDDIIVNDSKKEEQEDVFSSTDRFPDGWHTYQGGNELRGREKVVRNKEEIDDVGSVPMKEDKTKKLKTKEKSVKKESGMPIGAIAVMVTSGCVLVVAVAVAITIHK